MVGNEIAVLHKTLIHRYMVFFQTLLRIIFLLHHYISLRIQKEENLSEDGNEWYVILMNV